MSKPKSALLNLKPQISNPEANIGMLYVAFGSRVCFHFEGVFSGAHMQSLLGLRYL